MPDQAGEITRQVKAEADPDFARELSRFFQTGPGGYGEGDRFLGVRAGQLEAIARHHREADLGTVADLLVSPFHEVRMVAARILRDRYRSATSDRERMEIYRFYEEHSDRIDSWDLVDISAPWIIGGELVAGRRFGVVCRQARARDLWTRRRAVVATLGPVRQGDIEPAVEVGALVVEDHDDLIQKALGWVLREVGKRDRPALDRFLESHGTRMGRTAVRYAIELHPEPERRRILVETRAGR
ncbi:MAG: DNA alkylation repair protein [Solirubrobacterales bacterium]